MAYMHKCISVTDTDLYSSILLRALKEAHMVGETRGRLSIIMFCSSSHSNNSADRSVASRHRKQLVYTTLVVQACVLLDSWFYGAATVPPLRFLHYNVGLGVAQAFGVKTWHWYFSHVRSPVQMVRVTFRYNLTLRNNHRVYQPCLDFTPQ